MNRIRFVGIATALLLAGSAVSVNAASGRIHHETGKGFCLDARPGGGAFLNYCDGATEWWTNEYHEIRYYYIDAGAPGVPKNGCLDVNDRGRVYANLECNGGEYQKWEIQDGHLINHYWREHGDPCLDGNEGDYRVYMSPCNQTAFQHFEFR